MNFFHSLRNLFVSLYRLSNGRVGGHMAGLQVLLLTTIGRKSGVERTTPLGYFIQDGNYIITASNAGSDANPAWFHNLRANPRVKLEIQDQHFEAVAEVAPQEKRTPLWSKLISLSPYYANYTKKTNREIPMVVLHPVKSI